MELELRAPQDRAPYLELALETAGINGWVVKSLHPELRLVFYLPREQGWEQRLALLEQGLTTEGASLHQLGSVRDEDWAENWKAFYHPFRVGKRLLVCPSWEPQQPAATEVLITLDPGAAFGTGYHATTRLCLELLEGAVERLLPQSCLDYGTGSGILSIACLKLGVARVTAVDRDPVAVRVARENLQLNGLDARVLQAETPPQERFGLVAANLTADVLRRLAPKLAAAVAPGGSLVAGGIIAERSQTVVEAFLGCDMKVLERRAEGEWIALLLER